MRPPVRRAGFLLVALLAGCGQDEDQLYRSLGPRYEAREWLRRNSNPYPLASNRFESAAAAAGFVDSLYGLGADTVYVLNVREDSAWIARESGPYADALLIRLPRDPAARTRLLERGAREARAEGFDPDREHHQRYP